MIGYILVFCTSNKDYVADNICIQASRFQIGILKIYVIGVPTMAENEITIYEPIDKEKVKTQIFEIRGQRVMLDKDIATYFQVTTGNLNKAMKRNIKRFPENFCFQLTADECSRFQIGSLNSGRGSNIKYLPYVYTEQGVAMLTSTLHTDMAIEASIQIVEAFV